MISLHSVSHKWNSGENTPQNYDPIAPSHTGQIQTHKIKVAKVFSIVK
jgi:hypothetical protein